MNRIRELLSIKIVGQREASRQYFLMLMLPGRKRRQNIGEIFVDTRSKEVTHSFIKQKFRGIGLGKKLYGEVLKAEGVLYPDSIAGTNENSTKVWLSMQRRYATTVKGEDTYPVFGKRGSAKVERWGGVKFNRNTENMV